jgi:hypothetical protein
LGGGLLMAAAPICEAMAQIVAVIPGFDAAYAAGKIGGGSSPVPQSYVKVPTAREYYLDYQVYFESDWEWVKGGKLPGLVGGSHTSGCNAIVPDGWSARFMWRSGGRGQLYLYHQNRRSGCGDEYFFSNNRAFEKNKWNRVTQRAVINDPGQSNGLIEAWFNGEKVVTLNNVKLRGNVAANVALVDQVSLQTFYGGSDDSWAPSHTTHARYSQFFVRQNLPDLSKPFPADGVPIVPRRAFSGFNWDPEIVDALGRAASGRRKNAGSGIPMPARGARP